MNTSFRSVYGASRVLPRVFRRPIITDLQASEATSTVTPPQSKVDQAHISDLTSSAVHRAKTHEVLDPRYQVGGRLEFGTKSWDRHDEKGVPKWGVWGIPIKLQTAKGSSSITTAPNFWLRDNCRCKSCINQDTMQRAFDTFSVPADIMPEEVVTETDGLKVKWAGDGHISKYDWDWLVKHRSHPLAGYYYPTTLRVDRYYWGSEIASKPPTVQYDKIMAGDEGVGEWTEKIRRYGFCYVDGCPVSPEKTQELLERIAFIRVTHYGGFYDFTADLTMKDTAYTNLALPAHTDTTYFTDPAGLQMFHLLSHTDGEGGASLLVDGYKAARTLLKESKSAYDILAKTPISWHASGNEGITITPAKKMPVLNLGDAADTADTAVLGLVQVRWNNDDRGVVGLRGDHGVSAEMWYDAARKWDAILKRKENEYWAQLIPGRPLIFDNWRVLHVNHDDYISRWRNTNSTREEVLKQIL
ncbi:Trimethyllysine dioxygenase [Acephala macrosclerotiorum]|nr:Trimethyllysine dioxygenase [Acephala macrosclerotiorum]